MSLLPSPPVHYDYNLSTEANYAIKVGTSGVCNNSVRGTLQGEQYYLDRESMDDDHEREESGKEEGSNQKVQSLDNDKDKGQDKSQDKEKSQGSGSGSGHDGSSLWSWLSTTLSPNKPSAQHTLSNQGQETSTGTDSMTATDTQALSSSSSSSSPSTDTSCLFVGKYAAQRAKMDYSYHSHYQPDRQLVHDILIDWFLDAPVIQDADDASLTCNKPADQVVTTVLTFVPMIWCKYSHTSSSRTSIYFLITQSLFLLIILPTME